MTGEQDSMLTWIERATGMMREKQWREGVRGEALRRPVKHAPVECEVAAGPRPAGVRAAQRPTAPKAARLHVCPACLHVCRRGRCAANEGPSPRARLLADG